MLSRPEPSEYAEYYHQYVAGVPEGDILATIEAQIPETVDFMTKIGEEKAAYRYSTGKWSIKEILSHLTDVERLFQYRCWVFSRNDATPQPGMEQDDYVANGNADSLGLDRLIEDYQATRIAGLSLFRSFDEGMATRTGVANGVRFTVRSIPYILAGHNIHHMNVIKERYL